jgi:signal transduction histidine kinase
MSRLAMLDIDEIRRLIPIFSMHHGSAAGCSNCAARRSNCARSSCEPWNWPPPLLEQQQDYVHVDVPQHGAAVYVDRDRMAQAVANLLTNAAKYSNRGTRIDVRGSRVGDVVSLRVEDGGFGQ